MQRPNYDLIQRTEQLIAQECAKRGGEWQVGFYELADLLGENGKVDKIFRAVNNLAAQGVIEIRRSPKRDPHTYRYIGRNYDITPEFIQVGAVIQQLQQNLAELLRRIDNLQERDTRMFEALKGLELVGSFDGGYLYRSQKLIEETKAGDEK